MRRHGRQGGNCSDKYQLLIRRPRPTPSPTGEGELSAPPQPAPNRRPAQRVVRCKAHRRPQSAGVGGTVGGLPRTAPRRAFPPFPPSPPRHMVCGLRRRQRKSSKNQQPRRAKAVFPPFLCPAAAGNLPFLILPPHRGRKTGAVQPSRGDAVEPHLRSNAAAGGYLRRA